MFSPENELERVLMLASTDPAMQPQFYSTLTASTIFVMQPGTAVSEAPAPVMFEAGTKIVFYPVQKGDQQFLPFFSSLLRLQGFYKEQIQSLQFLEIATLDFFNLVRGAELVLNPGSEYGKEFTASEIDRILDGWKPVKTYMAEKDVPVRLGQPTIYPHALTEALSRLFSKIKEVESAYLAHLDNPDQGVPPHTLIGIKTGGDWDRIASQAGMVSAGVKIPNPPVDFLRMNGTGGLEDYLLTTKPFYKRKILGLF